MTDSGSFDPKWFTSSLYYEEGLLVERKERLFDLATWRGKSTFLKAIIALANSARRLHRSAHLLLGITDLGEIRGLDDDIRQLRDSSLPDFRVWEDKFKRPISEVLRLHVAPDEPQWDLMHGTVRGRLVSYIEIAPVATRTPYEIKKAVGDLRDKEAYLDVGYSFIRSGESSQSLASRRLLPSDWNYSYAESPYVLPWQWKRYLDALLNTDKFVRVSRIPAYQDACLMDGGTLAASLNDFVDSTNGRLYVLIGDAGVGKTTSALHWVLSRTASTLQGVQASIEDMQYHVPPGWMQITYSLRKCPSIRTAADLANRILDLINSLGGFWASRPSRADTLFEDQSIKWLVLFDGLDELSGESSQERFLDSLRHFLDRYPTTKAILTSRPISAERDWHNLPGRVVCTLAPFSSDQIRSYITTMLPEDIAVNLWNRIEQDRNLAMLCAYPTFLEALVDYIGPSTPDMLEDLQPSVTYLSEFGAQTKTSNAQNTEDFQLGTLLPQDLSLDSPIETRARVEDPTPEQDQEIPRLGILLHRAYESLWHREQRRHEFESLRVNEWWTHTGALALDACKDDGKVSTEHAIRIMKARRGLRWLLSLGVVRESMNSRDQIEFMTTLTHLYYSASKLNSMKRHRSRESQRWRIDQVAPQYRELLNQIYMDLTNESLYFEVQ